MFVAQHFCRTSATREFAQGCAADGMCWQPTSVYQHSTKSTLHRVVETPKSVARVTRSHRATSTASSQDDCGP